MSALNTLTSPDVDVDIEVEKCCEAISGRFQCKGCATQKPRVVAAYRI